MKLLTSQFSWHADTKRFVAEASDLQMNQIKPFTLRSVRTGSVAVCYLSETRRDGEGDVLVWVFKPVPAAVASNPGLAGVEIHVLND